MAEQAVDRIIRDLIGTGLLATAARPCLTAKEPLLPSGEVQKWSGLLPPEASRAAVEHYVASEWALHLDDVMLRRAGWHYYFKNAPEIALRVADWMGELLAWTNETRTAELERYAHATGSRSLAGKESTRRAGMTAS